jgi:hypothetical protein
MSDQLTTFFDQLRGQQPPAPFASPATVRRRGRQRSRRQALAAGTAAFTAAGLAVGVPWIADLDHRGPSSDGASPTATAGSTTATAAPTTAGPTAPPRTAITDPAELDALMLRAADVGPGVRAEEVDDLGPDGPGWPWEMRSCRDYRPTDYPTQDERLAARVLSYVPSDGIVRWIEVVESYPAGRGPVAFAEIDAVLERCASFDEGFRVVTQAVRSRDIAGDESILVRVNNVWPDSQPPDAGERTDYFVAVRVGDLIATVHAYGRTEAEARTLGERAAARLG